MVVFLGGSFLENKIKMLTSTGKFFLIFEYLNSKIHFFPNSEPRKILLVILLLRENAFLTRNNIFNKENTLKISKP